MQQGRGLLCNKAGLKDQFSAILTDRVKQIAATKKVEIQKFEDYQKKEEEIYIQQKIKDFNDDELNQINVVRQTFVGLGRRINDGLRPWIRRVRKAFKARALHIKAAAEFQKPIRYRLGVFYYRTRRKLINLFNNFKPKSFCSLKYQIKVLQLELKKQVEEKESSPKTKPDFNKQMRELGQKFHPKTALADSSNLSTCANYLFQQCEKSVAQLPFAPEKQKLLIALSLKEATELFWEVSRHLTEGSESAAFNAQVAGLETIADAALSRCIEKKVICDLRYKKGHSVNTFTPEEKKDLLVILAKIIYSCNKSEEETWRPILKTLKDVDTVGEEEGREIRRLFKIFRKQRKQEPLELGITLLLKTQRQSVGDIWKYRERLRGEPALPNHLALDQELEKVQKWEEYFRGEIQHIYLQPISLLDQVYNVVEGYKKNWESYAVALKALKATGIPDACTLVKNKLVQLNLRFEKFEKSAKDMPQGGTDLKKLLENINKLNASLHV